MSSPKKTQRFLKEAQRRALLEESYEQARGSPIDGVPLVGVREFVTSSDYLGLADFYPEALNDLEAMNAEGIQGYIIEAGLGGGKSYLTAALLGYRLYRMAYADVILKDDPRPKLGLARGSKLYVANVAIKEKTAKEIVFDRLLGAIEKSPWFREYLPHNPRTRSEIEFFAPYAVFPGHSKISSVAGFDVFAAAIDEANLFVDSSNDSGTKGQDYADVMFTELYNRVLSRFGRFGYLGVISSRKTVRDFTARKKRELEQSPVAARSWYLPLARTSWHNWPSVRVKDNRWRQFDTDGLVWSTPPTKHDERGTDGLWVPEAFWPAFETKPEEALRDLASLPSESLEPFIRKQSFIRPAFGDLEPPILRGVKGADWLLTKDFDTLVSPDFRGDAEASYHFHVDLALRRDAAAIAVAHCSGKLDAAMLEGETRRPEKAVLIDLDIVIRITAPPNGEIDFATIRRILYWLRDVRGFRFRRSSYDGWQSVDSQQILTRKGFLVEEFSLDRTLTGYGTLKDVLYERRLYFPPAHGQTAQTTTEELVALAHTGDPNAVLQVELRQLELVNGRKVDHPPRGSKDCADAVAGAVTQVQRSILAPSIKLK